MRIRSIKPEFFEDEELAGLPPFARLLFIGTWLMADKNGVFENRPRLIQAKVFPYDSSSVSDVSKLIPLLIQGGFLVPFEADGKSWLWIPRFHRHQRITGTESQNESRNPLPPEEIPDMETIGKQLGNTEETLGMNGARKGKGKGSKEREGSAADEPLPFSGDEFKAAWESWLSHKRALREKPYTPEGLEGQFKRLTDWGEARAISAIRFSIAQNWKGIFEEKGNPGMSRPSQPSPPQAATTPAHDAEVRAINRRDKETAAAAQRQNAQLEKMIESPTPEMLEQARRIRQEQPLISEHMALKMAAMDLIEGEQE
jgi:hypothetical protein